MNFKKLFVVLTVTVLTLLCTGTAFAKYDSLYPADQWFLNDDFDDQTVDLSKKYSNVQGNPMPHVGMYDDETVAVFDCDIMRASGKTRIGFSILRDTDEGYVNMKSAFEGGEEICLEFRANFQDDGLGCNELFFNDLFYIRYLENRTEFAGKNIKYPIENGWHRFSVIVYADENNVIRYKNLRVDDTVFDGDVFPASRDTFEEFYYRLGWFYISNYVSSSVNNTLTSTKMYLDYVRVYSIGEGLKNKETSIENGSLSRDTDTIELTFTSPVNAEEIADKIKMFDDTENEIGIFVSKGVSDEILEIAFDRSLDYSSYYKIVVSDVSVQNYDTITYSGEIEFFVENEPLYSFENVDLSNKTIDVRSALPVDKTLYFVTQMYDSEGKLVDADLSDAVLLNKEDCKEFNSYTFMKKDVSAIAETAKIFVFDNGLKNIYTVIETGL